VRQPTYDVHLLALAKPLLKRGALQGTRGTGSPSTRIAILYVALNATGQLTALYMSELTRAPAYVHF
jgi:hypothetical protein